MTPDLTSARIRFVKLENESEAERKRNNDEGPDLNQEFRAMELDRLAQSIKVLERKETVD